MLQVSLLSTHMEHTSALDIRDGDIVIKRENESTHGICVVRLRA